MVTPKEARKIAELLDNAPYANSCTNDAADALRDLASQVESLQADAERYRFRHKSPTWDAEIDAAMESRKIEP